MSFDSSKSIIDKMYKCDLDVCYKQLLIVINQ